MNERHQLHDESPGIEEIAQAEESEHYAGVTSFTGGERIPQAQFRVKSAVQCYAGL